MRRTLILAAATLALTGALAGTAAMAAPQVVSADHYAVQADYRGPVLNVGYSAEARRMTACLATYPGAYDPRTDLVRLRGGVTKRCAL